jgi:hypothetical protein
MSALCRGGGTFSWQMVEALTEALGNLCPQQTGGCRQW